MRVANAMPTNEPQTSRWIDQATLRPDRQEPYLSIQHIMLFVADQEASLRFYRDLLGFAMIIDTTVNGSRWIGVAPPDGTALIGLLQPKPNAPECALIGQTHAVVFITEDFEAKYMEWKQRGVSFEIPAETPDWGGRFARISDPDGNTFALVGMDALSHEIEAHRRVQGQKLEAERRSAQELELARQVQARLFPQTLPPLRTLSYAGACRQARQVGGDYYDFLDLGTGRVGFVICDIAGKGMAAALLMAGLQANLRGQAAVNRETPHKLLHSLNQIFYRTTDSAAYATFWFAEYDDATRHLRYANCGHLPALVLRANGTIDRLQSTCPVLGIFEKWNAEVSGTDLLSGDVLALYTDGIVEAANEAGAELGEEGLLACLQLHRELPAQALLHAVLADVQRFSFGEQADDLTLILVKSR